MTKLTLILTLILAAGLASAQSDVLINEVDADTDGTDILEFVELYGDAGAPLDGLVLVFYNGNGDVSYDAFDLDGFALDGSGFFLLGNAGVVPTPSIIFASNGLQNGADAVALHVGDGADFPTGTAVTTTNLIDAVVYDTNDADDAGLLALLLPGEPQLNEGGGGNSAAHSNMRCPDGGGGARVTTSFYQFLPTPGVSNNLACEPVADERMSWGGLKSQYR
ncbi:lamin tail domain-containing protein [bacterium]|nr:lamin tail domain-containing protein [bacterium]MBU1073989.1 lamin tail domain-containing protein [bacterium]MBU1674586.1 lamin tail domain-containing protein [bacterium]